jgi:hypothetical protein
LAAIARDIPSNRRAGGITSRAVWRWATRGITLRDGTVVRLQVWRVNGRYYSTAAAIADFIARQQEPAETAHAPVPSRTPNKRQRAADKAGDVLTAAGI